MIILSALPLQDAYAVKYMQFYAWAVHLGDVAFDKGPAHIENIQNLSQLNLVTDADIKYSCI